MRISVGTIYIHKFVVVDRDFSPRSFQKPTSTEQKRFRAQLENLFTKAREYVVRGNHLKSIGRFESGLYKYRFGTGQGARRMLFVPKLTSVDDTDQLSIVILANILRSNTDYDNGNYTNCIPERYRANPARAFEDLQSDDFMKIEFPDSYADTIQDEFLESCLETYSLGGAGVYSQNYAPPGSGKSHVIQELLLRYFEDSVSLNEVENSFPGDCPKNTIILVPSKNLISVYQERLQYRFNQMVVVRDDAENEFSQLDQLSCIEEPTLVYFGTEDVPLTRMKEFVDQFLFQERDYAREASAILLMTVEQFFCCYANKRLTPQEKSAQSEEIQKLVGRFPALTSFQKIIPELINGWPVGTAVGSSRGKPPQLLSLVEQGLGDDSIAKFVQQHKGPFNRLKQIYMQAQNTTLRSDIAKRCEDVLINACKKLSRKQVVTTQIIVDEHQDLIPNELWSLLRLLKKYPGNQPHTTGAPSRSTLKALFFGDVQQRVSNMLFSKSLFAQLAHTHLKLKSCEELDYKPKRNYRISRQMALFANCFQPRGEKDNTDGTFRFSDIPAVSSSVVSIVCINDIHSFIMTNLANVDKRLTIFSPHMVMKQTDGQFDLHYRNQSLELSVAVCQNIVVYSNWIDIKGLQFDKIIFIDAMPETIPTPNNRNTDVDISPLERAQLYMGFSRAKSGMLLIEPGEKKSTIERYLNHKRKKISAEITRQKQEEESVKAEIVQQFEHSWSFINEDEVNISLMYDEVSLDKWFNEFKNACERVLGSGDQSFVYLLQQSVHNILLGTEIDNLNEFLTQQERLCAFVSTFSEWQDRIDDMKLQRFLSNSPSLWLQGLKEESSNQAKQLSLQIQEKYVISESCLALREQNNWSSWKISDVEIQEHLLADYVSCVFDDRQTNVTEQSIEVLLSKTIGKQTRHHLETILQELS